MIQNRLMVHVLVSGHPEWNFTQLLTNELVPEKTVEDLGQRIQRDLGSVYNKPLEHLNFEDYQAKRAPAPAAVDGVGQDICATTPWATIGGRILRVLQGGVTSVADAGLEPADTLPTGFPAVVLRMQRPLAAPAAAELGRLGPTPSSAARTRASDLVTGRSGRDTGGGGAADDDDDDFDEDAGVSKSGLWQWFKKLFGDELVAALHKYWPRVPVKCDAPAAEQSAGARI
jgi:hypothetical protein